MFGEFFIRYRWGLVIFLIAAVAGAIYLLPDIQFDHNFSNYFPDKDSDLEFYHKMTAELGDEDDLLLVAIHRKPSIFDSVFLAKFQTFTRAVGKLPHVIKARSLTNLTDVRRMPFGNLMSPFLHPSNPALFASDSLNLLNEERLLERLVSADLKTLTVIMELEKMDGEKGEALISSIENLGREFEFSEMHLAGLKYLEVVHNRVSQKELKKGVIICFGLIIVLLGFLYRSLWGIMLPLMVYVFSMLLFLGYLVMRGHSLDIMTNLAPTIILIVSVSDVIHLLSKYEDQVKAGLGKREALKTSLNSIGTVIFMTSITTATGFLALLTSNLPVLRAFGGDIAVGVMLAFISTLILVPFVLYHISENKIHLRTDWQEWWSKTAGRINHMVWNRPKWITWSAVLLILISILGITKINTNHFFVGSLPRGHVATKAARFFENNLAGIRAYEIALIPKGGATLSSLALLKEVEKLDRFINSLPRTGGVYSPVTFYKTLNMAWHGGQKKAYALPDSQAALNRQAQYFKRSRGAIFHRIMNEGRTFGKVSARMNDPGRNEIGTINEEVAGWIAANLDATLLETRIIGASAMADKIQEYSIRNMFSGLALALAAVGGLIFLLYRKWRMVAIVMVINLFPLIITAAVMAYSGIVLRCITSVIFTIGFVIAVDDTIHFVGRYQMERGKGLSREDSITVTLEETGRAMLLTTIVLFFSFAQLITSSFKDAQAIGILVSVMLVFALLADLFLAPLLILKLPKFRKK